MILPSAFPTRSTAGKIVEKSANADLSDRVKSSIALRIPATNTKGKKVAVFAGGCFGGLEAVFEHVKGVSRVTSVSGTNQINKLRIQIEYPFLCFYLITSKCLRLLAPMGQLYRNNSHPSSNNSVEAIIVT
jgi:hypothetical protein